MRLLSWVYSVQAQHSETMCLNATSINDAASGMQKKQPEYWSRQDYIFHLEVKLYLQLLLTTSYVKWTGYVVEYYTENMNVGPHCCKFAPTARPIWGLLFLSGRYPFCVLKFISWSNECFVSKGLMMTHNFSSTAACALVSIPANFKVGAWASFHSNGWHVTSSIASRCPLLQCPYAVPWRAEHPHA